MRKLFAVLALAVCAFCSGDATAPETVAISFKIDAQTCKGSSSVDFFIDGSIVGTETMAAGSTSKAYTTTRSTHVLGAQISVTRALVWGPFTADLHSLATFTQVLTC